ncbi:MAG: YdcF family protein [Clostridiales Family XIII bacterium]|jgi:vancomycin permeability regulator SanA|nr:YdcF family protein [Clostridiales Family XIII bacterium]
MAKNKDGVSAKLFFGILLKATVIVALLVIAFVAALNIYVVSYSSKFIISEEEARNVDAQAIVVLGASVRNGEPSPVLAKRLDTGRALFGEGVSNLFLLSGDNGKMEYNEVQGMKNYILREGKDEGITDENIYLDYAGFSTYDSMFRLKNVFECDKAVITTQKYHLYRALYIANKLGIEAYGVEAADETGERKFREMLARVKDFFFVYNNLSSVYEGDPIPLIYPSTQAG